MTSTEMERVCMDWLSLDLIQSGREFLSEFLIKNVQNQKTSSNQVLKIQFDKIFAFFEGQTCGVLVKKFVRKKQIPTLKDLKQNYTGYMIKSEKKLNLFFQKLLEGKNREIQEENAN